MPILFLKCMNQIDRILSKVGDLNFKRRVLKILEYLDIRKEDKVLDAGCGEGFYLMLIKNIYHCDITGIDNDDRILSQAKKWIKDSVDIKIVKGDIDEMEFPDNTFDKVVCSEVLEHINNDRKAVDELYRVTKPGGILAVTVPNSNYPLCWDPLNKVREKLNLGHFNPLSEVWGGIWAYDHKRLYSVDDIVGLLTTAGFKVDKVQVLTHYGFPFNHLLLVLGKHFYTKLNVSEEIKNSMEKFKWNEESEKKNTSLLYNLIQLVFNILKKIDSKNDREFDLNLSTMAVSIKAVKPKL